MVFLGIDLHKRYSVITAMDREGEIAEQLRMPNDELLLSTWLKGMEGEKRAVVEATSNWGWLADFLAEQEVELILAHPLKTRAIASAKIKNDRLDSSILAHLLRTDLIAESYLAPQEVRFQRDLLRYRAGLVRIQTGIKNRVHALLIKGNVQYDFTDLFGRAGMAFLKGLPLPEVQRMAMDSWLELLADLRARIRAADREIASRVKLSAEARLLTSAPGIGNILAATIAAETGDFARFPTAKHYCSYAGLVPSSSSSGDKMRYGHITKQGNPWLRWALVEASWGAIKRQGPVRVYYQRISRHKKSPVAIVAVARKLAKNIYHMEMNNQTFDEVVAKHAFVG